MSSGSEATPREVGAGAFTIREYRSGDEAAILSLFRDVFGSERSAAHWRWKFRDNPYHPPIASLAFDAQGELVAHHAVIPVMLNVTGNPVLVVQLADAMVREDARMYGLFLRTAQHCFDQSEQAGAAAVYAFPNWNSYPGFIQKLGLRRVSFLQTFFQRLSYRPTLRRLVRAGALAGLLDGVPRSALRLRLRARSAVLRRHVPGGGKVRRDGQVPESYEALWNAIRRYEVLSVWKDSTYFRWRYDAHPEKRYEYFSLVGPDGDLLAMLVVKLEGDSGQICELLVRERRVDWGRYLVTRATAALLADGVEWVAFTGRDPGLFEGVFADFVMTRNLEGGGLCTRVLGEQAILRELNPLADNWTVTLGDNDAF